MGHEIVGIASRPDARDGHDHDRASFTADQFVNCAGLHSDRLARLAGLQPEVRIIPFRGEYYELTPEASYLVKGLIYPVPDPTLPFLGVHLTRMINGSVHAGPNAILALAREGYTKLDDQPPRRRRQPALAGLWRLGKRYWRTGIERGGADRCPRSGFWQAFESSFRNFPTTALRANACRRTRPGAAPRRAVWSTTSTTSAARQVHVLNAPSPAATASLEIGKRIADELEVAEIGTPPELVCALSSDMCPEPVEGHTLALRRLRAHFDKLRAH